jgi:hypothetical protein
MEKQWDKFEQLAATASCAMCILGNSATADFELIDVSNAGPLPLDNIAKASPRAASISSE